MNATAKAPSGMLMMLRALGVDPAIFTQVSDSVKAVASALERIEKKQDKIIALLEGKNGGGE